MTYITTVLYQEVAFIASDRTVSLGNAPYDEESNKLVLVRVADGVFSVSYTGMAYIDGKPTDRWIAEQIRGQAIEQGINLDTRHESLFLWEVKKRLMRGLESVFRRARYQNQPHEIMISGLRSNRRNRRNRPSYVIWRFFHDPAVPGVIQLEMSTTRFPNGLTVNHASIGTIDLKVEAFIRSSLKTQHFPHPDGIDKLLIGAVRDMSALHAGTIGDKIMMTRFNLSESGLVGAKFTASLTKKQATTERGAIYAWTPWILTPGSTFPPQRIAPPGLDWRTEHIYFSAQIDEPIPAPPGIIASTGTAYRRGAPRRNGTEPPPVSALE